MREWVQFAAAAIQGVMVTAPSAIEVADWAATIADATMLKYGERATAEIERPWTWGEVEIFGRRSHLGRYRWTADEHFLDVEELIIERIGGELIERTQPYRYSAKAIFSVSPRPEEDIRAAAKPYEAPPARDTVPPSSDAPESLDF